MSGIALSIVIPAYNEASRIGGTIDELRRFLPTLDRAWEIRVVDDGSGDGTAELVRAVSAHDARVVLQAEPHRGKGGSVRAGMLAARGALRFMCDADLSMPVGELPRFLALVPDPFDIVIGSREGEGARRVAEPAYRHQMGRVFNSLVRAAAVPGVHDTQCGFKLFSRRAAEAVFSKLTIDGWAFDIEALLVARRLGLRIREIPIEWHYRDRSQVSPVRDAFLMTRDVARIRWNGWMGRYDS
jgi:dolichyl-phosphate beta-glucosyltransferase